jgi:hypothetical protein
MTGVSNIIVNVVLVSNMTCQEGIIDTCQRVQIIGCDGCPHQAHVDHLEYMFKQQRELQERLGVYDKTKDTNIMMQHYIDRMLLAIHEEAVEIGRETLSKHDVMPFGWKHQITGTDENYRKEIIDLWHFTMNLWLVIDGTADEFFEMYLKKNKENRVRQDNNY